MTRFRIVHAPPFEMIPLSWPMTDRHFTVDTADHTTLEEWNRHNPHCLTYAFDGDALVGLIEILPLTDACGKRMHAQTMREEDIVTTDLMTPQDMDDTRYLYISGIVVDDPDTWRGKQCAAALVSCAAGMIVNLYDTDRLKTIFANPTTYWGHRIIGKFGLAHLRQGCMEMKEGYDFYGAAVTPELLTRYRGIEARYQRFMIDYPWSKE